MAYIERFYVYYCEFGMFKWLPIMIVMGFVSGVRVGQGYVERKIRKIVPMLRFVSEEDKLDILSKLSITLDENSMCHICEDNVILENLGIVIQRPSGFILVCSKTNCMTTNNMIGLQQEK